MQIATSPFRADSPIWSNSPLHPNVSFTQNLLLTLSKSSFNILLNFVSFGQYFCIPKLIEL